MAISLYMGLQGSGKSYEIVRSVIIPAVAKGRRVVSNVYGLDEEKIREYCLKHNLCQEHEFGQVVLVENEQVQKPDFYPAMDKNTETFCQPGDVVIIDECNRFFSSDAKLSPQVRSFAAEHRHFVSVTTGYTTDFILVNQGLSTIPRYLKERIDYVYRMKKLNVVPGCRKRYRVDIFSGAKLTKDAFLNNYIQSYDPEIFPLYKSFRDGVIGTEDKTDGRNVLFKKSTLLLFFMLATLAILAVWRYLIPFFTGKSLENKSSSVSQMMPVSGVQRHDLAAVSSLPVPVSGGGTPVSSVWCVSGFYFDGERNFVLLRDMAGRLRMVSRNAFQGDGIMLHGVVDGQQVNTWSCRIGGES
ncbi:TPA: zonular occludens toxin domain-containing protein [Salmonella enterica subsp. enterica serovar Poona]